MNKVLLVRNALKHGIHVDYVLMDTWFANEPMLKAICAEGLNVIGMVKQLKQFYHCKEISADWKICAHFFLKLCK